MIVMKLQKIFLLLLTLVKSSFQSEDERRIMDMVLTPYDILARPVRNDSHTITVKLGLTLMQIIDVDERNQILTSNCWLSMEWQDVHLQWNPSEFGNMDSIRVPPHRVWKPDILLYNSVDERFDPTFPTNFVVKSNGSVTYIPPGIFKSSCTMDMTDFPYDEQKCEMKFGSWTHHGLELDLELKDENGGDAQSYITHGEWELVGIPAVKHTKLYSCCPEPFVDVTFTIHLKRRGEHYVKNLMAPFGIISAISLIGFLLPIKSKGKLMLGAVAIFSVVMLMYSIAGAMPVTFGTTPFLCRYFAMLSFIVFSSILAEIVILNMVDNSKSPQDMHKWIRLMFLESWLPKILFVRQHQPYLGSKGSDNELDQQSLSNVKTPNFDFSDILKEIRVITDKVRKDEMNSEISNDWLFAANVINRFCLILLTIVTLVAIVAFLA